MYRRRILNGFFKARHNLSLTSIATPLILGCKDHIEILDPELAEDLKQNQENFSTRNKFSQSEFAIDGTENPHPRFPGLMKSIRERRGEKVKILVPMYHDVYTS